ncbi:XdhC family protein [Fictibacillus fluitans]|uniref:XdhC family protein n=1 Tax=Fictibacillus fluitans TaxID=3058422 RepID=A0ABT8HTR5_9BACL|nr:XdhC family protein [Fictibacillus sp. NE201]MDN4523865.1 XdhC family protein [Fictibacillus sp. NE201]
MKKEVLYHKLSEAILNRTAVSLVTFTEAVPELIGKRILLLPETAYGENGVAGDLTSAISEFCSSSFSEQHTSSLDFHWQNNRYRIFHEAFPPPPHLIIAGAGHVGEPVAHLGKMLGFSVTVVDDRSSFANKERFSCADEVCCQSFHSYFQTVPLKTSTYILLLTRGHQFDVLSLQQLLSREERPAYIGMIGSRRRIAGVFEQLRHDFPEETFTHIHTPVGLDIGAETPAEIAVSIFAEILAVKNKKNGEPLSSHIRELAKKGFRKGQKRCGNRK